MAGTLFGLPLSQRVDANGRPLSGGLLYIYAAGTTTPSDTFEDYALSNINSFPLVLDSAGTIPEFWVADGSYRARLTTSTGTEVFDSLSITAIGPSSGSSGGGGSSIDETTISQTGDVYWTPAVATRTGWVRLNARTIGSGSSSSTERSNADCSALFIWLWDNFADSICAVSSGRGASGQADFNANKTIALLDMRGKGAFGLDTMGNSAASVIAAGTPTVGGTGAGAETVTIAQSGLPNIVPTFTGTPVANHQHPYTFTGTQDNLAIGGGKDNMMQANSVGTAATGNAGAHTPAGTISSINGNVTQSATNKMPPYLLGTWLMKL